MESTPEPALEPAATPADPPTEPAESTSERPPWSGRDLLIVLGMGILGSVGLLLVYGAVVSLLAADWSDVYTEGGLALIYVAFGLSGWHFALRRNDATWADAGFRKPSTAAVLSIVPAYVLLVAAEAAVVMATEGIFGRGPGIETQLQLPLDTISTAEKVMLLVGAVVAAPLAEEFLFRGLLYRYMRSRMRIPVAIGITSLVFAALHGFLGLLPVLFVFGIVMAIMTQRFGTIVPSIALHALNNGIALLTFFSST